MDPGMNHGIPAEPTGCTEATGFLVLVGEGMGEDLKSHGFSLDKGSGI